MRLKRQDHPVILIILLVIGGLLYLGIRETGENIISVLTGFGLGLITKFLPYSIEDKIKNNDTIRRFFRISDSLRGKPECESNDIRYYDNQNQLPNFYTILEITGLNEVYILGLTSEPLLKKSFNQIQKSLEKGIRFNFLILNPESKHVPIQSENFNGGKDLKYQINRALELISDIKTKLPDNLKNKLTVKLYDEQIGKGMMLVSSDKEAWIKTITYVVGSDSDCRPSMAGYLADNEKFYRENKKEFDKIWYSKNTILYKN